jgi:Icc-related predicted phosphoesterase
VGDWFAEARARPTLEDELAALVRPRDPARAVYVIHMPPAGVGLDVCHDGGRVGSDALRAFLLDTQPLMSLHGHIHESPRVSGVWRADVGRTVAVQPGQEAPLAYIVADLESTDVERVVE